MSSSSTELTGSAKLEDVTRLMANLTADLQHMNLLPHQRDAMLEQLKVYGRNPTNAEPIFTKEGIETLTQHALNSPSLTTSRNALRCLANAMLLKANTRQIFVDLGYESKACNRLKNDSWDDEFLVSRIIFLTTYDSNVDIEKLIDQYQLAENICVNIGRHANQYVTKQKIMESNPMEDMALVESLKLLFNLTHFCPQRNGSFSPALPHILMLLSKRSISSSKPLDPPIGTLINALINLPLEEEENVATLFPESTAYAIIDRLVEVLDKSTKVYTDDDLEHLVSPLLTLIRKLYEIAPNDVQLYMQQLILPSNEDRQQPLGRTESLSSRLLRQSTNPATAHVVRESISSLLFELSDKDARSFVQNVGYGFASGFLFQHNVPIPENALEASGTGGGESSFPGASQDSYKPINPITGQTLESEPLIEEPEMTQEEKEREAERLFVLFERLNKTGVMSVKNPVEAALQEGRFQELEDDAESE